MDDDLWSFGVAMPAIIHKGTNDGTMPICVAAKYEYGIGKIGESRFVCAPDDMPDPRKYQGYAGYCWCPECEWVLTYMRTSEFTEYLKRRGSTVPWVVIGGI